MKTYTWKTYEVETRRVWYDRHFRLWVMQQNDADDNQIGPCHDGSVDYTNNRKDAMDWLNGRPITRRPPPAQTT
jgi:hypothetical protein